MIVRIDGERQPRPIDGRIDHLDCPAGAVERGQAQASVVRRVCNPREIVHRVECERCERVAPLVNGFDIPSGSIEGGVPHVEVSVVFVAHTRYVFAPFVRLLTLSRQFVPVPSMLRLTPFHSRTAVPGSARLTLTFVNLRSIKYVPFGSVGG